MDQVAVVLNDSPDRLIPEKRQKLSICSFNQVSVVSDGLSGLIPEKYKILDDESETEEKPV